MCKFCKRLKELNDLDKESFQACIDNWKRYARRAELIFIDIELLLRVLQRDVVEQPDHLAFIEDILIRIKSWRSVDYIGK